MVGNPRKIRYSWPPTHSATVLRETNASCRCRPLSPLSACSGCLTLKLWPKALAEHGAFVSASHRLGNSEVWGDHPLQVKPRQVACQFSGSHLLHPPQMAPQMAPQMPDPKKNPTNLDWAYDFREIASRSL